MSIVALALRVTVLTDQRHLVNQPNFETQKPRSTSDPVNKAKCFKPITAPSSDRSQRASKLSERLIARLSQNHNLAPARSSLASDICASVGIYTFSKALSIPRTKLSSQMDGRHPKPMRRGFTTNLLPFNCLTMAHPHRAGRGL